MKIERLEFKAFGCFTDVALDFSTVPFGVHMLYGPNEAGKSLALEGLRQWLYGIDRNIPLDFKHKKGKQRIGGTVSSNGSSCRCFRKRGNSNTLVDEDERPVGDEALRPFLQGIDENRFRNVFGITHFRLREGGQEIAAGKGVLGQALFAAGSGLLRLDRILNRLEDGKERLFGVRGDTRAINSCLKRCQEATDKSSNERLSLKEFTDNLQKSRDLQQKRDEVKKALSRLQERQANVDRLIRVGPLVRRRKALLAQLEGVQNGVRLRDGFRAEFNQLDRDLLVERKSAEDLAELLRADKHERDQLVSDPAIVREGEALQSLGSLRATYETDSRDLPGLISQRNQIQGEAKQFLRALGREPSLEAENIERLRLDEQARNRIRELGTRRAEYFTSAENAAGQVAKLGRQVLASRRELEELVAPSDTQGLAAAVNRITRMGDLSKALSDAEGGLEANDRTRAERLARQALWVGALDSILSVAIPSAEAIDHHRDALQAAEDECRIARERTAEFQNRLVDLGAQLERLRQTGDVPAETDLDAQRSCRQHGWDFVRSAWLEGVRDESAEREWIANVRPDSSLVDAYETTVELSDQIADRLRREANRVTEQAALSAEQHATQLRLANAELDLRRAEEPLHTGQVSWKALWLPAAIDPRSPREMRLWLDQWNAIVASAQDRRIEKVRVEKAREQLELARSDMRSALEASGALPVDLRPQAALDELMSLATQRIELAAGVRQKKDTLQQTIIRLIGEQEEAAAESGEAERKKTEWEEQWDASVGFLGAGRRLMPDEVNRTLDTISAFWTKFKDFKNRQNRIQGIESRSGGYPQAVFDLAERLEGRRPSAEDPLRVHDRLQDRSREADSNGERRGELERKVADLKRKHNDRVEAVKLLEQRLQRLCQEGNVQGVDELPEAMRRSDERKEIENRLQECEDDLQVQGGMAELPVLCVLVEDAEREHRDYGLEKSTIQRSIEVQEEVLTGIIGEIGACEEAGRALRSRAGAGESAAEMESEYASLREHLEDYTSLVLASYALNEAIRRYRAGSSTGLLAEASRVFQGLTCGSFERLAISEEEGGAPYLVGVRPDGSEVLVGGMSDGTCDQLYLALRVAHLRRHVQKDGPFPFIVDDILLTFDDDRSKAALRCFADLGRSTQVLLFTHHRHLRHMAEEPEFAALVGVHDLC